MAAPSSIQRNSFNPTNSVGGNSNIKPIDTLPITLPGNYVSNPDQAGVEQTGGTARPQSSRNPRIETGAEQRYGNALRNSKSQTKQRGKKIGASGSLASSNEDKLNRTQGKVVFFLSRALWIPIVKGPPGWLLSLIVGWIWLFGSAVARPIFYKPAFIDPLRRVTSRRKPSNLSTFVTTMLIILVTLAVMLGIIFAVTSLLSLIVLPIIIAKELINNIIGALWEGLKGIWSLI